MSERQEGAGRVTSRGRRGGWRKVLFVASGVSALAIACGTAHAQVTGVNTSNPAQLFGYDIPNDYDRGSNTSVLDRPRPGYDAIGIRRGAWTYLPRVEAGPGYISNVFGATTSAKSDGVLAIAPSLSIHNASDEFHVQLDTGLNLRKYIDTSTNDETGAFANLSLNKVIDRDTLLSGGLYASRSYVESDSGGFPTGAISPIAVNSVNAVARASRQLERYRLIGALSVQNYRFESVETQTGAKITEGYQDRTVIRLSGRGEYGLTPDTALFGQLSYSDSNYRLNSIAGSPERDSQEVRILGGGNFDLSHLARGYAGVGFVDREYSNSFYGSLSGFAADVQVEYFPTQLTTVTGDVQRLVQDATSGLGSPGYFSNTVSLSIDHELLRNLILSASGRYEYDDYSNISRLDRIGVVGVAARYLLTREVGFSANLQYVDRASTGTAAGPRFDDTRLLFTIVLQR